MTSPLSPEAVAQMVADMADGLDMAAEAEVLVIDGLEKYVTLFQADDRDTKTMRALRVYNEAKSNHRRFVNEACALRAIAAENATLRAEAGRSHAQAERAALLLTDAVNQLAALRASEAAAQGRVTTALEIAQTRHIPDQPAAYGGSELEWAQGQYASLRRDIIAAITLTADKEPKP